MTISRISPSISEFIREYGVSLALQKHKEFYSQWSYKRQFYQVHPHLMSGWILFFQNHPYSHNRMLRESTARPCIPNTKFGCAKILGYREDYPFLELVH